MVPFWAAWPFETLLIPKRPAARLSELDPAALADLTGVLHDLLGQYYGLFGRPCGAPAGRRNCGGAGNDRPGHRSTRYDSGRACHGSLQDRANRVPASMRALVYVRPGEMALMERPDRHPDRGEVLVAVRASGICGSDVHGYLGLTGRRQPGMVMGHEAAGEVVEVGPEIDRLAVGDRVVLGSILSCGQCERCRRGQPNVCEDRRGLGMQFDGAYAERMVVPEALALRLPDVLTYEQAALVEPLAVALHAVAITPLEPADDVVIVGAGPIGLLTLLAVRLRGARSVAITDRSPHRLAVAQALGADLAIDVATTDPVAAIRQATNGRGADVVFEAVGVSATVAQSLAVARTGGQVTWIGNSAPTVELPMQEMVTRELTLRGSYTFTGEFDEAVELLAAGRIDVRPLIELTAPLDDGPEIFRQLGAGTLDAVKVVLLPGG